MSKAKTPLKVLRVTRKRLAKGWTKGTWTNFDSKAQTVNHCIEGAMTRSELSMNDIACTPAQMRAADYIHKAMPLWLEDNDWVHSAHDRLLYPDTTAKELAQGTLPIPTFNDNVARDINDVLALIDIAIVLAEADEGFIVMDKVTTPAASELNLTTNKVSVD